MMMSLTTRHVTARPYRPSRRRTWLAGVQLLAIAALCSSGCHVAAAEEGEGDPSPPPTVAPGAADAPEAATSTSIADSAAIDSRGAEVEERFALEGPVLFPEDDPDDCQTPESVDGLCVNIKYCPDLQRVSLTALRRYICGFEVNTPLLCCPGLQRPSPPGASGPTQPVPPPLQPVPPPPQQEPPATPPSGAGPPQQTPPGLQPRPPRPDFLPQECGIGAFQRNRIVGGRVAAPGAYPWIIAMFVEIGSTKQHVCGATLVTRRHVISAAHCFFDGKRQLPYQIYRMRLGEYDITRDDELAGTVELGILGYKTHPGYVQKTYLNDISLSYLNDDAHFSATIGPVCLPYTGFERDLTNERAIVAGWGYTKYQGGKSSPILKETDIPVWSLDECRKAFQKELNITDDYLCAGDGEGKTDSCQGDSGGPLIMWGDDNRYYLMGIVSFGKRCATPGYPGAYTRITKQLGWLNANY